MNITQIEKFIQTSKAKDLAIFLKENPNYIYHYSDQLFTRLSEIFLVHRGCMYGENAIDIDSLYDFLCVLFLHRKEIKNEVEFNLLETMTRSIITEGKIEGRDYLHVVLAPNEFNTIPILSLLLLLTPTDLIVNDKICNINGLENTSATLLYQDIVNFYIPCMEPELLISTFYRNYHFTDVIKHLGNTNWFIEIYQKNNLQEDVNMKDLLLLFKHVSDIYMNREAKFLFFVQLHYSHQTNYSYRNALNVIADRFRKYFKEDTEYIITELIRIGLEKDQNELKDDLEEFVVRFYRYNSRANVNIIRALVRDSISLGISHFGAIPLADFIVHYIEEHWTDPKFDVELISYDDDILLEEDKPISYLENLQSSIIATEATVKKGAVSAKLNSGERKVYNAYRTYKEAEDKVDSQITKALSGIKGVLTGDVRSQIIEGKKFSAISLLKKLLGTVAIFSYSKIAGVILLVVKYALKKKTTDAERNKILIELETEIDMLKEKIDDAKSDDAREAKYAMMRTLKELETAYKRISLGLDSTTKAKRSAMNAVNNARKL